MSTISKLSNEDLQKYRSQAVDAITKYKALRDDVVKTSNLRSNPNYYTELNSKLVGDYTNAKKQKMQDLMKRKTSDMQMYEQAVTLDDLTKYTKDLEWKILQKTSGVRGDLNTQVLTYKRQVMHEQIVYKNLIEKISYLKYIATILSFGVLVLVAGAMEFMSVSITISVYATVLGLGFLVILYTMYLHVNDDPLTVSEKKFPHVEISDDTTVYKEVCNKSTIESFVPSGLVQSAAEY